MKDELDMEAVITFTELNDFIFCPLSLYFHALYKDREKETYQCNDQAAGKSAHERIDRQQYASKEKILQGMMVYTEKYNLLGKIDTFDIAHGHLCERKKVIKTIYPGYIFQLYAQYFALNEMGYHVSRLSLYSIDDHKHHEIPLPAQAPDMIEQFEALIRNFRNDNLIVSNKDGKIIHQSTCYRIFMVCIVGHFTVTSGLLQRAKKYGFGLLLFSHSFRIISHLANPAEGNTLLLKRQYTHASAESLEIAKWLCIQKTINQERVLKKARLQSEFAKERMPQFSNSIHKINGAENLSSLLGLEGANARMYFQLLFAEYAWSGRKPRVKHDINNCLLDIGYTLLFTLVEAILNCFGFDLYIGFYHQVFYQRKSLVCDLVEPFRCIVDYHIRKMNRLKMINPDDFVIIQGRYELQYKKSAAYVNNILGEILKHKDEIFLFLQSFYRAFMKEKAIDEYPAFRYE